MPITNEMIEKNKERAIQRWTDITEFEMHQIREFRDSAREVEANSEGWEFNSIYPSKDIDDMTHEESMNFRYFITVQKPVKGWCDCSISYSKSTIDDKEWAGEGYWSPHTMGYWGYETEFEAIESAYQRAVFEEECCFHYTMENGKEILL